MSETKGEKPARPSSAAFASRSSTPILSELRAFWSNLPLSAQRKALLIVFILTAFFFLVVAAVFSYHVAAQNQFFSPVLGPLINYHMEFVMALAFLGVAVGAGVFYLSLGLVAHKQHDLQASTALLLKFLSEDEREVVSFLLSRRGACYQSELSSLPGMTRIRSHRVVQKLLKRGLVQVGRSGRLNRVELAPELLEGLQAPK